MSKSIITQIKDTGNNLATKITLIIDKALTETYFKIYVCNNGNDVTPTWENCTSSVNNKTAYLFTNITKTATNGAIMVKLILEYDSTNNINTLTSSNYTFNATYVVLDNNGMSIIDKIVLKDFTVESTLKLWYEYPLAVIGAYESITDEVVNI